MTIKTSVKRLFNAFGKRASEGQSDIYYEWAEKADPFAEEIIEGSIQNDTTFPPLARLNSALVNKRSSVRMFHDPLVETCYLCCDTGAIPYLFDPEDASKGKHYIRMYACKCSQAMSGMLKYFDEWHELQFERLRKNYDGSFQYPHIVDSIKLESNNLIDKN